MRIIVFSTKKCPNCITIKKWLKEHKIKFKEKNMENPEIMSELIMKEVYSLSTPILQIGDKFLLPNEIFKEDGFNENVLLESFGVKR